MKYSLIEVYQDLVNEMAGINPGKHYTDGTIDTKAMETRYYSLWLKDGEPSIEDFEGKEPPPYAHLIETFKNVRESMSAFSVKNDNSLLYLTDDAGSSYIGKEEVLEKNTKLKLLKPLSRYESNEITKIIKRDNANSSVTGWAFVKTDGGLIGFIPLRDIQHHFSKSIASGQIGDKHIGYGVETAIYLAINSNKSDDDAGLEAISKIVTEDDRVKDTYKNATDIQRERFNKIIKRAVIEVREYQNKNPDIKFSEAKDPILQDDTSQIDVPVKVNGKKAEIHAKYNDDSRLFGLRAEKGDIFIETRNEIVNSFTPTLESYRVWIEKYKEADDYIEHLIADLENPNIKDYLEKNGKLNLLEKENIKDWRPITKHTNLYKENVFLDPRSMIRNMHTGRLKEGGNDLNTGIHSLVRIYPDLLSRQEFKGVKEDLEERVKNYFNSINNNKLSPGGVYYFNFEKLGELKVTKLAMAFDEISVETNNWKETEYPINVGYIVKITLGGQDYFPFIVQISSRARSRCFQILKNQKNNAEDFNELIRLTGQISLGESKKIKKEIISEGGKAGHMMHPYENLHMPISSMKEMIRSFQAGLEISEKVDGANLFFTVNPQTGQILFSRNKSDMTHEETLEKFGPEHPAHVLFTEGANSIYNALKKALSKSDLVEIFGQGEEGGKTYINFEIMHPKKPNQIKYDMKYIVFHAIVDFDINGTKVNSSPDDQRLIKLLDKLSPYFASEDNDFNLGSNLKVKLNKLSDEDIDELMKELDRITSSLGLSDNMTIADAVKKEIEILLDQNNLTSLLSDEKIEMIYDFITNEESTVKGVQIKKGLDKEVSKTLASLGLTSKTKAYKIIKEVIKEFKNLFVLLGIKLLDNVPSRYMSQEASSKNVDELRLLLNAALTDYDDLINKENPTSIEERIINSLDLNVASIRRFGIERAVSSPVEGGVFIGKDGNTYKVTGGFAPLNQILGTGMRNLEAMPNFANEFMKQERGG